MTGGEPAAREAVMKQRGAAIAVGLVAVTCSAALIIASRAYSPAGQPTRANSDRAGSGAESRWGITDEPLTPRAQAALKRAKGKWGLVLVETGKGQKDFGRFDKPGTSIEDTQATESFATSHPNQGDGQ
jgi:hypothetical protein